MCLLENQYFPNLFSENMIRRRMGDWKSLKPTIVNRGFWRWAPGLFWFAFAKSGEIVRYSKSVTSIIFCSRRQLVAPVAVTPEMTQRSPEALWKIGVWVSASNLSVVKVREEAPFLTGLSWRARRCIQITESCMFFSLPQFEMKVCPTLYRPAKKSAMHFHNNGTVIFFF